MKGKKSTQDEMGVAALKAVEIDDSLGGVAKQVQLSIKHLSNLPYDPCLILYLSLRHLCE